MIIKAKTAGFCFGVARAVEGAYALVKSKQKKGFVVGFGELIHNGYVIRDLEQNGMTFTEDPGTIEAGSSVVIRAHGVAPQVADQIRQRGCEVHDFTCPYVQKIHEIVKQAYQDGRKIVIAGDRKHPEVIGINGCCGNTALIVEEVGEIPLAFLQENSICLVAQTTFFQKKFYEIINFIEKNCKDALISDTICNATEKRQQEAEKLASVCDMMVVIGGKNSSNTVKLYQICRQHCKEVYLIENFEELPQNINLKMKKIGITAGASTPSCIIEEVVGKMEEKEVQGTNSEELSFAEAFEQSLKTLNTGDVVRGIVVEVRPNEVIVDLGFKSDGIIPADELSEDPNATPDQLVKVGDEIEVFVVGVNDAEGKTLLSRKKLDAIAGWKKIKEAEESGAVLDGKVVQVVNGGMIVVSSGTRVFVPISQANDRYTQDLTPFVGKEVQFKILEVNEKRRKVVGSVKAVLQEQNRILEEKFWGEAEVGKKYNGTVKSITPFGAFIDLGGVDGLLHISEISWKRIKHPSEVLSVGQLIEVYIKGLDQETKKVSLGFKKAEDNPWNVAKEKYSVGDIVSVKIVRMLPFGAFAEILPTVDGLIHISQISNKRIAQPSDCLEIGQVVEAQITEADWDNKKISLSIRALIPKDEKPAEEKPAVENGKDEDGNDTSYSEEMNVTIGDVMDKTE
jgi:(E)-4-hydroxy-3-methyl-but-2-enyl pyrophosphate reductase